jgi:hypothetical protein
VIDQQAFLRQLTSALHRHGIQYMLVGSMASSFHGEPRSTRDIDIVIECGSVEMAGFLRDITDLGWYVSEHAAAEAVRSRSMFNLVDPASGWKADLIVRKDRPFSREEFTRRSPAPVLGESAALLPVASAEDTILTKLEWHRATDSTQQMRDAAGIAALRARSLDLAYLRRWSDELGLRDLLERILSEVDALGEPPAD